MEGKYYKMSAKQKEWAAKNAERIADSMGFWHSLGCPAAPGGQISQCTCNLMEIICYMQHKANARAGLPGARKAWEEHTGKAWPTHAHPQ